jgi:hypothetical protein
VKYVRLERDGVPFEVDGLRDRAEAADRAGLHDVAVFKYLTDSWVRRHERNLHGVAA